MGLWLSSEDFAEPGKGLPLKEALEYMQPMPGI